MRLTWRRIAQRGRPPVASGAQGRRAGRALSEEIKLEALLKGCRFREVPIPYRDRIGDARLRKWRDGWENLSFLLKKRWRS
jgi:hypothetical protein